MNQGKEEEMNRCCEADMGQLEMRQCTDESKTEQELCTNLAHLTPYSTFVHLITPQETGSKFLVNC